MLTSKTWPPALAAILLAVSVLASGGPAYADPNLEGSNVTVINPGSGINVTVSKPVSEGNTSIAIPRILSNAQPVTSDYEIHVIPNQTVTTPAAEGRAVDPGAADTSILAVSDGTYSDPHNVTVTTSMENATNRNLPAPDILVSSNLATPSIITPAVTGPDGNNVTITGVMGATLGTVNTNWLTAGYMIYRPEQTGMDTITYTISDGRGGAGKGTIYAYANGPGNTRPVLDAIHNTGTSTGGNLNFTATATDYDGDPLVFVLVNAPDGATINADTGYFSWTPAESQNGRHKIAIAVHDGRGGADWQYVTIHVLPEGAVNYNPIAGNVTATVVLGDIKAVKLPVSDPDSDDAVITSVSGARLGSVFDTHQSAGIITYVAGGTLGEDIITYTVSDGRGGTATGAVSITIIEPLNINPMLDYVGDSSINALQTLTFTVTAIDIDGIVTSFGLQDEPSGATMTTEGEFSWTPDALQEGSHDFTVIVFDDADGNDTETITVTVRPAGYENLPPTAPHVVIAASQDIPNIARPVMTDPDEGDRVMISETGQTAKGRILSGFLRAGIIVYQPGPGQTGTETVDYTASDTSGGTDVASVTIFINENGNDLPVLESIDHQNINADDTMTFDVTATDPDNGTLSYMLVGAPDSATISPQGVFSWMPAAADEGNYTFIIVAYDEQGGSDTQVATIHVLPAGTPNRPPIAPSTAITVDPGASIVIEPEISDPDGDSILITDAVTDGDGVIIPSDDSIDYIHVSTAPTETITYNVTDARGATSTGIIIIQINTPRPESALSVRETAISTKLIKPTVISTEMADSNNAFAIDFYQQLASSDNQTGRNIFFSPSSVYNTFSLLYEGAEENTAVQMQDAFGFEPNSTMRHNGTAHTLVSINRYDSDAMLHMANALWLADWFAPYDLYVDTSEIMYLTNIQRANFTDPDHSITKINGWTANKTGGKIDEIITRYDVNDDTSMILTNAVYFDGTWVTEFSKNDTRMLDFWINGNSSKKTDFMHIQTGFNYTESDEVQVLKLPYRGDRLSMLVILPQAGDGLEALEKSISSQQIDSWINNMQERSVIIYMPKFEIRTNYDLKKTLESLGVTDVFDKTRANLGDIVDVESHRGLYVSHVMQNAYVKVDEKGAEATTAPNKIVTFNSPHVRFTADHPFIFTIYDEESDMILLMGRIADPATLEH